MFISPFSLSLSLKYKSSKKNMVLYPKQNANVNHGLGVIMLCQRSLVDSNKLPALTQDVHGSGRLGL